MKNVVSFEPKSWWKDDIYWLRKGSCFELFGGGKYGLFGVKKLMEKMIFAGFREVLVLNFSVMGNKIFFISEKVDEKIIFTWSFWAFHDIPGPGKYAFSCSVCYLISEENILRVFFYLYRFQTRKQGIFLLLEI